MTPFIPKRAMAITPHADDVTLFAGGTLALWIEAGCKVMVLRVTQDEKDSFFHSVEETTAINRAEFHEAMKTLGVLDVCDFDYRDCELMDVPYGDFRGKLIREIRKFRPELILGFDPAVTDDENPDHSVVARAVADASWASGHPNFHPEHKGQDLATHIPQGQYYFTRHFIKGDTIVNISSVMDKKIQAVIKHKNMLCTMMKDQKLRIEAAGFNLPFLSGRSLDDYTEYWEALIVGAARMAACGTGYEYVERFRSTIISSSDPLVQLLSSLE